MGGQRVLILGTGPSTMGQGSEYVCATAAACRTLRSLGHTVFLLESHAAALACDTKRAHATYIEPLSRETVEKVLVRERPHSVLATVSGRHAFNTALLMQHMPLLQAPRFSLFGSSHELLDATQNTEHFTRIVQSLGLKTPKSFAVGKKKQGEDLGRQLGFPVVVRAVLATGGIGTAITYNTQELDRAVDVALAVSPVSHAVIEKSLEGCKRTAWEVIRDTRDHVAIVGNIEYIEPLGIHSADSPAVAPVQSLGKEELQHVAGVVSGLMRRFQLVGTATIHLAHGKDPRDLTVVSIAPYVTSTSLWCGRVALLPIADWHTRLCAGQNLEDLQRAARVMTDDLFETPVPQEAWVWCRLPLFPDWRLMGPREPLSTYTRSTGYVMGAGPDFITALQKAVHAAGLPALGPGFEVPKYAVAWDELDLRAELAHPTPHRLWHLFRAVQAGVPVDELHQLSRIDPWFIERLRGLGTRAPGWVASGQRDGDTLSQAKAAGCSDDQLARALGIGEQRVREQRERSGVVPGVRTVQAAQPAEAPALAFHILTHGPATSRRLVDRRDTVVVIGSDCSLLQGRPEFEFVAAHGISALNEAGWDSVLVSPNPLHMADEADAPLRHYIEAVQPETVRDILEAERPCSVMLQFAGRQTERVLDAVAASGAPVLGTPLEHLARLLHRDRFQTMLQKLDIRQPSHGMAGNAQQVFELATDVGYPVIVHPAEPATLPRVAIWYDQHDARAFLDQASQLTELYPLSIETFLEAAREFHVEAIGDGTDAMLAGVLEHVEEAGIHSADSAAVWPSDGLTPHLLKEVREVVQRLVRELGLRGLFSVKCAVAEEKLYLLDVLPHATRSTALLHTVTGGRIMPVAVRVLLGSSLREMNCHELAASYLAVRVPVFPFSHFPGSDASLGPENCSVGQAIGIDRSFGIAYAKALTAAGNKLPTKGNVLLSIADRDKDGVVTVAKRLRALGFGIVATGGTASVLQERGIPVDAVSKLQEGRPNVIDQIIDGRIQVIINTPGGKANKIAEARMRHEAAERDILVITTIAGARAAVAGIEAFMRHGFEARTLETYLKDLRQQQELHFDPQPAMELNV